MCSTSELIGKLLAPKRSTSDETLRSGTEPTMADARADLETMTCAELLQEVATLTAEGDHTNAEVGTPARAAPQQAPQVSTLIDTRARMDRITHLLKDKGCEDAGAVTANETNGAV